MHAAVDVGILGPIVAIKCVNHALRLLGGRRVVEVDERLAAYQLAEDRGILAGALHRKGSTERGSGGGAASLGSDTHDVSLANEPASTDANSSASSWARSGSILIWLV